MPAGHNVENRFINGIKCDKENDVCFFNDEEHKYYNKDTMKTYISCTTIVHQYCQPFQADFWSAVKAMEKLLNAEDWSGLRPLLLNTKKWKDDYLKIYNVNKDLFDLTRQEILDEWDRKKNESCVKGTAAHLQKEMSFYNQTNFDFSKYGVSLNDRFVCKENYYKLDLENGVYPEFLIQWQSKDGSLMIAGISDLVIIHGNELYVIDWKTSKTIEKKSYYDRAKKSSVKMKFPLNHLDDCNFNTYQLQASLYAWMIQQQRPDLEVKGLMIIKLNDDGSEEQYPCEYLKEEVEKMIKHYYKQMKVKNQLDRCKEIKY